MFTGPGSGKLHIGRRVQLVVWLQIMQEWIGIAGVTIYAPIIFRTAGISQTDVQRISGPNTTTYMGIVHTHLRLHYRSHWPPMDSLLGFGGSRDCHGGCRWSHHRWSIPARRFCYGQSIQLRCNGYDLLVHRDFGRHMAYRPWLYPAEIFPLEVRAKGNAWGVVGWSVGNSWLTLLCPVMFKAIKEKTYYIFAAANVITIPMVWALYPESNQRTLEEMNLVFAADSIWNWEAERNFKVLKEHNPELVQAVQRGHSALDPETGLPIRSSTARNMSLDVRGMSVVEEKQTFKHG